MTPLRIEYAPRFFRRMAEIQERISESNPVAAERTVRRIRSAIERLVTSPGLGRPGRISGTRELVISGTPYIVPYRVRHGVVQIITILHSAQKWPDSFP